MTDDAVVSNKDKLVDANLAKWFWGILLIVSVGTLLFEIVRMSYEWLRYGASEKVLLQTVVPAPKIAWVGVQKAISFVWTTQLFAVAIFCTIISGWLWSNYDDEAVELKRILKSESVEIK